jgi:hypothetical protein
MICQSYWKLYHWQAEHECGTCMMVFRAVRDVLSNTYHGRWRVTGGPTASPPRSPDLNLVDIYLWRHLNTLVYAAPGDRHFNIALWMSVRLSATAPASLHGCGDPWWDVNLMKDILSTYKYKCTLSTVSGHILIWTLSICFGIWNCCLKFVSTFPLHPVYTGRGELIRGPLIQIILVNLLTANSQSGLA